MAVGEILSQAEIDKVLRELEEEKIANEAAAKLGEAPPSTIKKHETCRYICVYCKKIFNIEYERIKKEPIKIAPIIFLDSYKTRGKPCKNICGHWYVSAEYLKSLKK